MPGPKASGTISCAEAEGLQEEARGARPSPQEVRSLTAETRIRGTKDWAVTGTGQSQAQVRQEAGWETADRRAFLIVLHLLGAGVRRGMCLSPFKTPYARRRRQWRVGGGAGAGRWGEGGRNRGEREREEGMRRSEKSLMMYGSK